MSKISVIVPVYNVEKYLNRCVDSILCQTHEDLEVILVDDGSTDGSGRICDKYKERDERIVVIHKDNGGLSSARNSGLDVAKGRYIGFVDSDDYILPEMYESLYRNLIQYDADYATGGLIENYMSGQKRIHGCHGEGVILQNKDEAYIDYYVGLMYNRSSVCCKLLRKELVGAERFTQGIHGEDIDFMYRIIDRVKKVVCINETVYCYIHREHSITTSEISEHSFDMIRTSDRMLAYFREKHPNLLWIVYVSRLRWILDIRRAVRDNSLKSREYARRLDDLVRRDYKEYRTVSQIPVSSKVLMHSMKLGVYNTVYPVCYLILKGYNMIKG